MFTALKVYQKYCDKSMPFNWLQAMFGVCILSLNIKTEESGSNEVQTISYTSEK